MEGTTKISRDEFLKKIEEAKKALDEAPHFDKHYILSEELLKKVFEIAVNGISVDWLRKLQAKYAEEECWMSYAVINEIIDLWRMGYEPG